MKGIYQYIDLESSDVVYVGKDSNINKNQRHNAHMNPSRYDEQQINRVLQNNPDRYEYSVLWASDDCTTLKLNKMEILFGKIYNPKFNFGKFGKGGCNGHSKESRKKMAENHSHYWEGKTFSEDHKKKISENHPDISGEKHPLWGKHHSEESKLKISKANNTSGYYKVYKKKDNGLKQWFSWCYNYLEDSKPKYITSVDIDKLETKVKAKDLPWRKL